MRVVSGQALRVENHHVTWTVIGVVGLLGVDVVAHSTGPDASAPRLLGALAALAVIAVTLVLHTRVRRRRWALAVLAVLATLTYVPLAGLGAAWLPVGGALSGAAAATRPGIPGRAAALLVLAGHVVLARALTGSWPPTTAIAVTTLAIAIALARTYGLDHLRARHRSEVVSTEITAMRRERRRFARDLHDLLGRQLSVVILEGEMAQRALRLQPEEARRRITALLDAARQTLADVRTVVRAYRRPPLNAELTSARQVLEAAGIHCEIRMPGDDPPGDDAEPLGPVLFEAITNVLRHARATTCRIVVEVTPRRYRMSVTNDGTVDPVSTGGDDGTGLAAAREHVAAAGGTLHAAPEPPGSFRLVAEIPRGSADHDSVSGRTDTESGPSVNP